MEKRKIVSIVILLIICFFMLSSNIFSSDIKKNCIKGVPFEDLKTETILYDDFNEISSQWDVFDGFCIPDSCNTDLFEINGESYLCLTAKASIGFFYLKDKTFSINENMSYEVKARMPFNQFDISKKNNPQTFESIALFGKSQGVPDGFYYIHFHANPYNIKCRRDSGYKQTPGHPLAYADFNNMCGDIHGDFARELNDEYHIYNLKIINKNAYFYLDGEYLGEMKYSGYVRNGKEITLPNCPLFFGFLACSANETVSKMLVDYIKIEKILLPD